ncbi:MAG: hypothetical protein ABI743_06385 [bacterium]
MSRLFAALSLGFLLMITSSGLSACHHGSDSVAPAITSLTPAEGPIGIAGESVTLSVAATGVAPLTYLWVISTGGGTLSSATAATTTLTLGAAGSYTATVAVTDSGGTTTGTINFTVDDADITINGITPDGVFGLPAAAPVLGVDYDGVATDATWTFADGTVETTASGLTPTVHLKDPGSYSGTVVLENAVTTTDPFDFDFTVAVPVAPNWTRMVLGPAKLYGQLAQASVSATVHDGKLAIVASAPDGLRLFRALVAAPCCPSDWTSHVVDATGFGNGPRSLISYEGRLVVNYISTDVSETGSEVTMKSMAVANIAEPMTDTDWTTYRRDEFTGGYEQPCALLVASNGDLVMVATVQGPWGKEFARATVLPLAPEDWTTHSILSEAQADSSLGSPTVAEIDGRFYVIWSSVDGKQPGTRRLAISDDLEPASSDDWTVSGVRSEGDATGAKPGIFDMDGLPCFVDEGRYDPSGMSVFITSATTPTPGGTADWTQTEIYHGVTGVSTQHSLLGEGRALAVLADGAANALILARQTRITLLNAQSWETSVIEPNMAFPFTSSTAVVGDRIAVAYVRYDTAEITIALSDGPF